MCVTVIPERHTERESGSSSQSKPPSLYLDHVNDINNANEHIHTYTHNVRTWTGTCTYI